MRTAGATTRKHPTPWAAYARAIGSARAYTRYILAQNPNAKICILYQDDDFGRDYPAGVRDVLGGRYAATVKEATYEPTDKTIDPQIIQLKATGCDAFIAAAFPDFAVQTIGKVYGLGWKPIFFMANISTSQPPCWSRRGSKRAWASCLPRTARTRAIRPGPMIPA